MYKKFLLLFLCSILFTGCIPFNETVKLDLLLNKSNIGIIEGTIVKNKKSSKDYYLVLYKLVKEKKDKFKNYKIVEFSSHAKAEKFKFVVTEGIYYLYACQNPKKLSDKKLAHEFYSKKIVLNKKNEKVKIEVKLSENSILTNKNNLLISTNKEPSIFSKSGRILKTNLDNKIFDRKNAKIGLWKSKDFFSNIGDGIYMLEQYYPQKTPILFVHGMNGTPKDFEYIISKLNKEKYQPFLYYYPSGINLNFTVDRLRYTIEKIRRIYNFNKIIIVAHSMGGLVSRAFINRYSKIKIEKFITIATPWNGQKFAELGKDIAPKILPVFGNMIPGSAFQKNIQQKPFPKDLKHYLLFGYKGKSSFILDKSNDGVISLSSQLFEAAQIQAYSVHGFDESHISILNSKQVVNKINTILKER